MVTAGLTAVYSLFALEQYVQAAFVPKRSNVCNTGELRTLVTVLCSLTDGFEVTTKTNNTCVT